VLGLNYLFYKFTINFMQYWWFFFAFSLIFILPYFFKKSISDNLHYLPNFVNYLPNFVNYLPNFVNYLHYSFYKNTYTLFNMFFIFFLKQIYIFFD
jgi:hypothetical protein